MYAFGNLNPPQNHSGDYFDVKTTSICAHLSMQNVCQSVTLYNFESVFNCWLTLTPSSAILNKISGIHDILILGNNGLSVNKSTRKFGFTFIYHFD